LTGHVKTIAGQKNIEEGAVSRMNNVLAELLNLKKYTKTKEEAFCTISNFMFVKD
jgi:hypothetical protein